MDEHDGHLTLRTAGSARVSVGQAVVMWRKRELDDVAFDNPGGGYVCLVIVTHRTFAPIHTATARSAPRPAVQMKIPSVTGPSEPNAKPPGLGAVWSSLMYFKMARF